MDIRRCTASVPDIGNRLARRVCYLCPGETRRGRQTRSNWRLAWWHQQYRFIRRPAYVRGGGRRVDAGVKPHRCMALPSAAKLNGRNAPPPRRARRHPERSSQLIVNSNLASNSLICSISYLLAYFISSSTLNRPAMPLSQKNKDLFSSELSQFFKKYHPSGNLKFNNLGISQSLKLRILMEEKPSNFS